VLQSSLALFPAAEASSAVDQRDEAVLARKEGDQTKGAQRLLKLDDKQREEGCIATHYTRAAASPQS
jgi:hypothetical protein